MVSQVHKLGKLAVWSWDFGDSGRVFKMALWEQRLEERCCSGVQLWSRPGKKNDQKHLSHLLGPILGLRVNSGPSWICLQCLAGDLAA